LTKLQRKQNIFYAKYISAVNLSKVPELNKSTFHWLLIE
jgi:hypothetical protein